MVPEEIPAPREPVDDYVALWIKRKRDEFTRGSYDWVALDVLLDDYRDHRVTGTPLDQEVEMH